MLCFVLHSQWVIPFQPLILNQHRSQWTRGLKRGFAAARLLGLQVRIPSGTSMSASRKFCICYQVKVYATSWLLVQRSPIECGVSECVRKASIMRRPWPTRNCCAMKKKLRISKTARSLSYGILSNRALACRDCRSILAYLMVIYQYVIQHMHSVIHHLWHISTPTCFGI